ncbi:MAG TPA: endo-1,4-beta-xylanase [Ignavibacteriaceae bacterium]
MKKLSRRIFIRNSTMAGMAALVSTSPLLSAPALLLDRRTVKSTRQGELLFKPYFVQDGRGPHLYSLAWATDKEWDTFYSDIHVDDNKGVLISDIKGTDKFGINVRWNVEGFGWTNITADNNGEFYTLPSAGKSVELNLNYELCGSRVVRNRSRLKKFSDEGWKPSPEVLMFVNLSEQFHEDAKKNYSDNEKCAGLSQKGLLYAIRGSEKMELEKAGYDILQKGRRDDFFIGCDARAFYQMYQDKFLELFPAIFNYANITFVAKGDGMMSDYQSGPAQINPETRELLINKLNERNVKCQERLLFWFHDCCIPDWLRNMKYDELLKYAEKLTKETMRTFGDKLYAMEVVNELHDWANELQLDHDQITELVRLINDVAKSEAPDVKRTINNCCPFAEYVQLNSYSGSPAKYPQRTPYKFSKDLIEAGIDIDILEQQMYFPYRDLQDSIMMIEKLASLGKPMQISEIGCPGGPTNKSVKLDTVKLPVEPYLWHQPWDEHIQADWLEDIYTLIFSKPYIHAGNWFDFVDPYSYMENGGLLRSPEGEKKEAYLRFEMLKKKWDNLPQKS